MPRYFTLAQAERTLPKVEARIREALFVKAEHQRADEELRGITRKILLSGGAMVDRTRVAAVRNAKDRTAVRLQEACEQIQEFGCFVKDLDIGLLDFPTLYKGNEVYLCWRLGEDRIRFWHQIDDGFPGRKTIDDEFLANHAGGGDDEED